MKTPEVLYTSHTCTHMASHLIIMRITMSASMALRTMLLITVIFYDLLKFGYVLLSTDAHLVCD